MQQTRQCSKRNEPEQRIVKNKDGLLLRAVRSKNRNVNLYKKEELK